MVLLLRLAIPCVVIILAGLLGSAPALDPTCQHLSGTHPIGYSFMKSTQQDYVVINFTCCFFSAPGVYTDISVDGVGLDQSLARCSSWYPQRVSTDSSLSAKTCLVNQDDAFSSTFACVNGATVVNTTYCPEPPVPANWSIFRDIIAGNINDTFHRLIEYRCSEGFTLQGSSNQTCGENGKYQPEKPPFCSPDQFQRLPDPSQSGNYSNNGQWHSLWWLILLVPVFGLILAGRLTAIKMSIALCAKKCRLSTSSPTQYTQDPSPEPIPSSVYRHDKPIQPVSESSSENSPEYVGMGTTNDLTRKRNTLSRYAVNRGDTHISMEASGNEQQISSAPQSFNSNKEFEHTSSKSGEQEENSTVTELMMISQANVHQARSADQPGSDTQVLKTYSYHLNKKSSCIVSASYGSKGLNNCFHYDD